MQEDLKIPHVPVLIDEVASAFKDCNDGYIIDCTLGYGGHSEKILQNSNKIKMICNDQDKEAIDFSKNRLKMYKDRCTYNHGNFKDIFTTCNNLKISGIFADIGVSSLQLDKNQRGFSFESQTLDMRMDQGQELSASDVVNNYKKSDIENILKNYGEVRDYKNIANIICENRPFASAKELSSKIKSIYKINSKIHPATLVFQAIRIEVNNELAVLENLLKSIDNENLSNCIVAIISFHSLEDRIVKSYFKKWSKKCICPPYMDKCTCSNNNQKGKMLTKKPIIPTKKEIKQNPRSRSSKLRIFKID